MKYSHTIRLKDGREGMLRNAEGADAEGFLDYFIRAHGETDYLTTYPDETDNDPARARERLDAMCHSDGGIEVLAIVDGKIAGSAGFSGISPREKTKHRAEFGISVLKAYWGLGIGNALTAACIECARQAGYLQLELEAVGENESALRLYRKQGFEEYGRNPRGFRKRSGEWQELVLMRLEL